MQSLTATVHFLLRVEQVDVLGAALMQRGAPEAAALEVVGASIEGGAFGVGTSGAEADQPPAHAGELTDACIAGWRITG